MLTGFLISKDYYTRYGLVFHVMSDISGNLITVCYQGDSCIRRNDINNEILNHNKYNPLTNPVSRIQNHFIRVMK